MADVVECPKCGKRSIVSLSSTLYHCLSCDFKRDLSSYSTKRSANQEFPLLLVVIVITLIAVLSTPEQPRGRLVPQQSRQDSPVLLE
jgi:hypothetical protein